MVTEEGGSRPYCGLTKALEMQFEDLAISSALLDAMNKNQIEL